MEFHAGIDAATTFDHNNQLLSTPPLESVVSMPSKDTLFIPESVTDEGAGENETATEMQVKQEPADDTINPTNVDEDEDAQDERLSAMRLREELEEIARNWFTSTQAVSDQQELESAILTTYWAIGPDGKWSSTDYVANLKMKFEYLQQAWRMAEDDRDSIKNIVEMMAGDPGRYHQAILEDQAWVWKEALRRKKMAAEAKWLDHRAKATKLKAEVRKEENQAEKDGIRMRKQERIAKGKAKERERKAAAKAKAKSKAKVTKTASKAKSTKGRK